MQACVMSASAAKASAAAARLQLPPLGTVLTLPELTNLAGQVTDILAKSNFFDSAALQKSADQLMATILAGLSPDGTERAKEIRSPFMTELGNDLLVMIGSELGKLGAALAPLTDNYVDTVMGSLPLDPQARAADLQTRETRGLMDVIHKIALAQRAMCAATPRQKPLFAGAVVDKRRRKPHRATLLGSKTRKRVKAGNARLTVRLKRSRVAKLGRHHKRIRVVVRINLLMPSSVLPGGYPRTVDELVTLKRGRKKHR
jgi:hypothetical protein